MIGELLGAVASIGVNSLMSTAVKTITPNTVSKLAKIGTAIGVWAISGVIGKAVTDEVNYEIYDFKEKVKEKKQQLEEQMKEKEAEG